MKFRRIKLSVALASVCVGLSFGQSPALVGQMGDWRDMADIQMLNNEQGETIDLNKVTGSPYLNPSFQKGIITNLEKNEDTSLWLRYNVFSDNIEAKADIKSDEVAVVDRSTKYDFTLLGEKFVLVRDKFVFEKKGSDNGYMAQISDPEKDVVLYKNYSHDFTPPVRPQTSYDVERPGSLKINVEYYIKVGDRPLQSINPNKKKIANDFPSNFQDDIKKFVNSEGLKFKGDDKEVESQLRQVIDFYTTLLKNV